jgi:2-polyprenyl-3-methyl-5-hydroxy-6-metoxy-1,4-benzoquinol methylase
LTHEPVDAVWVIVDGPARALPHQVGVFVRVTESTLQVGPSFEGQYLPEWIGLTSPRRGAQPSLAGLAADLVVEELLARFSNLSTHVDRGALMLDLASKQFTFVRTTGTAENTGDAFAPIAQLYRRERREHSPNALVVDPYLERLARCMPAGKVLDIGAGTGEASLLFARHGHDVTALEPSEAMARALTERLMEEGQTRARLVRGTAETAELGEGYDLILLNMVLDHVEDCARVLHRCREALAAGGRLVVVVPHPFKDSGSWEERFVNGEQHYLGLTVRNYFYEGPMIKARYSRDGEVVVPAVRSFKRGLGFYFAALRTAGFSVAELLEPGARGEGQGNSHHAKASQVPYFLIFVCTKETSDND